MKDGDGSHGCREMVAASAVVAEDAPVLEASEGVLDASPAAAMATPGAISNDPVAPEDGDAKASDAAVPAVGKHAPVLEAERLDFGATKVKRVVPVAWTAGERGHDAPVSPAHEHLSVARPAVVLEFRSAGVVAGGDEGAIDDPGLATIPPGGRTSEAGESGREGCDDAMDRRLRLADDGGELAHGEVRAERDAGHEPTVRR
ncbi:MAG: hypothetical protein U0229_17860 [Anaeromyxobacter sp.]